MNEDIILIKRAQKGDKEAFGQLYKKYLQKIYRYCLFNTKNEEIAKDICQDSFVKAWKKIKSFKTDGNWSLQSFLFTIARNLIIDGTRKKKEVALVEDDADRFASVDNLYDILSKEQITEQIKKVLSKLDEIERQIIILRYFEEMSSQEVAKILNVKDGALRVRTFRTMQKMKEIYESLYGKRN